jgi:hypothetical protein
MTGTPCDVPVSLNRFGSSPAAYLQQLPQSGQAQAPVQQPDAQQAHDEQDAQQSSALGAGIGVAPTNNQAREINDRVINLFIFNP